MMLSVNFTLSFPIIFDLKSEFCVRFPNLIPVKIILHVIQDMGNPTVPISSQLLRIESRGSVTCISVNFGAPYSMLWLIIGQYSCLSHSTCRKTQSSSPLCLMITGSGHCLSAAARRILSVLCHSPQSKQAYPIPGILFRKSPNAPVTILC